jgi:hypothetical protein
MSHGTQCNKCEKWFTNSSDIGVNGKEQDWSGTDAFNLCVQCTIRFIREWLTTNEFRANNYREVEHEGRTRGR